MRHLPNILTILRLLLVPCFLGASMEGMFVVAFVIFVSAAVTDILDGMIARRWNVKSRLGALLDPAADKTLMVCGFLYYTFGDNVTRLPLPGWLTFTVFIRDFLIAFFAYVMWTRVHITRFPPSMPGKISTVLQAVTLATTIAVNAFLPQLFLFAELLFRLSLLMTLFSGWGYMRRASLLLHEDGAPARA
ncbi:MAG: CDP-alcohol phosphatidyltransferase family protein [Thermoanaerobaculia bacterium]